MAARYPVAMTNTLTIWIAGIIIAFFAIDLTLDWGASLFLIKKFADLIEWAAFWR